MDSATRLTLDGGTLDITFTASVGPFTVRGRFGGVSAHLLVPADGVDGAACEVRVDASSIDTGLALRDRHLRGPSFLDVARHPCIEWASESVTPGASALRVAGVLRLRGIARRLVFRVPLPLVLASEAPATVQLATSLELAIRDFGVGVPRGRDVANPFFRLVGPRVRVRVALTLPSALLLPLSPAHGR